MEVSATDELLAELLAHAIVLRARADELTRVLARRTIALPDVLEGANRISDRMSEVLRVARILGREDDDPIVAVEQRRAG